MNKIEHFPVNWTDGEKLTAKRFFEQYNNTIETIKEYSTLHQHNYNFGLLDKIDDKVEAVNLEVVSNNSSNIAVQLKSCNAVTLNGYRLFYHKGLYGDSYTPKAYINLDEFGSTEKQMLVVLSINPFKLIPVGIPDPDAVPLHHPYALPEIQLHIVSKDNVNENFIQENHLIVGELFIENKTIKLNDNFIPPVKKIKFHHELNNFNDQLVQSLIRSRNYAILIYKRNKNNGRVNHLSENTFTLCNDIINFYSNHIFYLAQIVAEQSPIFLTEKIAVLANMFSASLNIMDEKDKEMLLQYYYDWTDIKPSQFIHSINDMLTLQYEHTNIKASVDKIERLISLTERLFKKISELEYIGQTKENIVVSEEKSSFTNHGKKNIWSVFD